MAATAPITPESLAQRTASINDAIARIITAATAYAETTERSLDAGPNTGLLQAAAATTVAAAQEALAAETKKLLAEVLGPFGAILELLGSTGRASALRCLLELDVFAALPADGTPTTADELVRRLAADGGTDVEKALLVRLLRNVTDPGSGSGSGPLVAEAGEEAYALTPFSAALRGAAGAQLVPLVKQVFDESFPALVGMPEFFRERGWRVPADQADCPYTSAHRTGGLGMWDHIARFPDRQANCNAAMKAQSFDGVWAVGLYPFSERLGSVGESDEDEKTRPLVVDVGGGAGYTSRKIRELCAGIKGTVVLQDREMVVADAEDLDGVVRMAHDFFAEQPVKGAHIYYLRRILHDWSDAASVTILSQLAAAMDRDLPSRVVVAEQILPARGVSAQSAWVDLTMMTFTGMERTEGQWGELLARAGLRVERVYRAPGTTFAAIEAVLA
ncbi:hypothetical protein VPNG_02420 [Cytospora leucostoma]|uniref:O-methyltransferase C-terminal domain-containing protein n=1 Tax=Cytospora leucostoma TaxID=1230097 RepID=A0A423XGS4_9PEZI|nr:hypothetical protein VPNG_02420 [Cytospora leucostoma]